MRRRDWNDPPWTPRLPAPLLAEGDDGEGGGQGGGGEGAGAGGEGAGGGEGGGAAPGWLDGLSDGQRQLATTKGWDKAGVGAALDAYGELEGKIGQGLFPPKDDAPAEEWDRFYARLGRPEKAEAYTLKPADGVTVDKDLETWFRGTAHKHGITQRQAQGLFDEWNAAQTAAADRAAAESDAAFDRLKAEKGGAWDDYAARAKQAVAMFVPKGADGNPDPALLDQMEKMLGTAALFQVWASIGEQVTNIGALPGGGARGGLPGSPEQAKAEIARLQADAAEDAKHPLNDREHPRYKEVAERWKRLHEIAYPSVAAE